MKKGVKISAILGTLACFALNAHLTYAKEVQIEKYTLNTSEQILSTERMINSSTIQYSKPSTTYDFVDENQVKEIVNRDYEFDCHYQMITDQNLHLLKIKIIEHFE